MKIMIIVSKYRYHINYSEGDVGRDYFSEELQKIHQDRVKENILKDYPSAEIIFPSVEYGFRIKHDEVNGIMDEYFFHVKYIDMLESTLCEAHRQFCPIHPMVEIQNNSQGAYELNVKNAEKTEK